MIILIWIGLITIFFEIKNRERSDKIFYTFYLFVMSVIILPFMSIFGSVIAYTIFILIYSILMYSIYTDFEIFTKIWELALISKKINKKQILKIDYEFLELLTKYYKSLIKEYKINIYSWAVTYIDIILIILWLATLWFLTFYILTVYNVL